MHLARRVDWRFLLPSPDLGRVGVDENADAELVEACASVASSIDLATPAADPAAFDVVVLSNPTKEDLEDAASLVRPGGWIYAETWGLLARPFRFTDALSPRAALMILRSLGFERAEAHWHWPDFQQCTEMIPLTNPAVVRYSLGRHRSGLRARFGSVAVRFLLILGVLDRVVTHASVKGRLPESANLDDLRN